MAIFTLWILVASLVLLLVTLCIHCVAHFRCICGWPGPSLMRAPSHTIYGGNMSTTTNVNVEASMMQFVRKRSGSYRRRFVCRLTSIDDESFAFFPNAFCLSVSHMIALCVILIIKWFLDPLYNSSLDALSTQHSNVTWIILDYLLIYGVIILSTTESLFNFYRFYSTKISANTFQIVSSRHIISRFMCYYGLTYMICFVVQTHFVYWLFPVLLAMHCILNLFCNLKFASILVKKYESFLDCDDSATAQLHNRDVLDSVLFMKRVSLLSNALSIANIFLFFYFYHVAVLYYLAPFWSLASFISSLNFVRNRRWIQLKAYECQHCLTCCKSRDVVTNSMSPKSVLSSDQQSPPEQLTAITPGLTLRSIEENITDRTDSGPHSDDTQQGTDTAQQNNYDRFNQLLEALHLNVSGDEMDEDAPSGLPALGQSKSERKLPEISAAKQNQLKPRPFGEHLRANTLRNVHNGRNVLHLNHPNVITENEREDEDTDFHTEDEDSLQPKITKSSTQRVYRTPALLQSKSNAVPASSRPTVHGNDIRHQLDLLKADLTINLHSNATNRLDPTNTSFTPSESMSMASPRSTTKKNKALALLGLTPSHSNSVAAAPLNRRNRTMQRQMDKSKSYEKSPVHVLRKKPQQTKQASARSVLKRYPTPSNTKTKTLRKGISTSSLYLNFEHDDSPGDDDEDEGGVETTTKSTLSPPMPLPTDTQTTTDPIEHSFSLAVDAAFDVHQTNRKVVRFRNRNGKQTKLHLKRTSLSNPVTLKYDAEREARAARKEQSVSHHPNGNSPAFDYSDNEEELVTELPSMNANTSTSLRELENNVNINSSPPMNSIQLSPPIMPVMPRRLKKIASAPHKMRLGLPGIGDANSNQSVSDSGFVYNDDVEAMSPGLGLADDEASGHHPSWKHTLAVMPTAAMPKKAQSADVRNMEQHKKMKDRLKIDVKHTNTKSSNVGRMAGWFGFGQSPLPLIDHERELAENMAMQYGPQSADVGQHANTESADIDQMLLSLNVLAKHGFCSRNSINSMTQLKLYQQQQLQQDLNAQPFFRANTARTSNEEKKSEPMDSQRAVKFAGFGSFNPMKNKNKSKSHQKNDSLSNMFSYFRPQ